MNRLHFLAAELFAYSFDNYQSHLEVGNLRFMEYMPADVENLLRAEGEGWPDERIALELDIPVNEVAEVRQRFRRSKDIVDAPTPAETFRRGVRYSIQDAVEEGLASADDIERLAVQVCYRAADLSLLLDQKGMTLSEFSTALRAEPDIERKGEGDMVGS